MVSSVRACCLLSLRRLPLLPWEVSHKDLAQVPCSLFGNREEIGQVPNATKGILGMAKKKTVGIHSREGELCLEGGESKGPSS